MKKIIDSVTEIIGNTPMLRLHKVTKNIEADILVKLEFLNPSGSTKDRIALRMIEEAESEGILKPGSTIVEASTGNTAIALSFMAALKGYKMKVFMPKIVSGPEKLKMMQIYGAEIEKIDTEHIIKTTDKSVHGGKIEIIPRKKSLEFEQSNSNVWWARQFCNSNNSDAHKDTTGKEILDQTDCTIDAFVASVGTGGTLVGIGQALKSKIPNVKIFAVEPETEPFIQKGKEGIPIIDGISGGLLLQALDLVDDVYVVKDKEAIDMANRLMREEGLRCGMSSGANVYIAIEIAKMFPHLKNIVTVLPDSRDRYLDNERYTT